MTEKLHPGDSPAKRPAPAILWPVRVGIDLISVDSVRESIETHADRYLQRVYTEQELADCACPQGVDAERLAARFAAKEAALKVLRATDTGLALTAIAVRRSPQGWVELELTGDAARLAREEGLSGFAVSLSHEAGFATAVVVADSDYRNSTDIPMHEP
jgi:holo-[acyl-carrier protein] synthase